MPKLGLSHENIQPAAWGTRAVAFLEGVSTALAETKQLRLEQPVLFLRMHMAQYQLAAGNVDACKAAVSGAKDELDRLHDVRPHALGLQRCPCLLLACYCLVLQQLCVLAHCLLKGTAHEMLRVCCTSLGLNQAHRGQSGCLLKVVPDM